jgi:prepilin-type N-terminal cleavage/methylation domain-containing protein
MSISTRVRQRFSNVGSDAGFGLVELLIAMTVLVVGITAVFALFFSSALTTHRASRLTTALTLAESKMETMRAVEFTQIGLDPTALAGADATYTADSAYSSGSNVGVAGSSFAPTATATGADGRSYRIDTYIVWQPVTGGRNVKRVTIVVRGSNGDTRELARIQSFLDEASA